MNIGIVGDRYFDSEEEIDKVLWGVFHSFRDVTIVTGDCPTGVDRLVTDICLRLGHRIIAERVNRKEYERFGKQIYYWRNLRLVRLCDYVVIVVKKPYKGRGSAMVRELCIRELKPYRWVEV